MKLSHLLRDSKSQLIEASHELPRSTRQYRVRRYCSMPLAEDSVAVTPNHKIVVEWVHQMDGTLTPLQVSVFKENVNTHATRSVRSGSSLYDWLARNANEH